MKFHLNLLWRILTICSIALVVNPRSLKLLIHLVYEYDIQSGVSVIWSCWNLSCYHTQTPMGKTRHNKFLHLRNPNLIDHFTRSIAPNETKDSRTTRTTDAHSGIHIWPRKGENHSLEKQGLTWMSRRGAPLVYAESINSREDRFLAKICNYVHHWTPYLLHLMHSRTRLWSWRTRPPAQHTPPAVKTRCGGANGRRSWRDGFAFARAQVTQNLLHTNHLSAIRLNSIHLSTPSSVRLGPGEVSVTCQPIYYSWRQTSIRWVISGCDGDDSIKAWKRKEAIANLRICPAKEVQIKVRIKYTRPNLFTPRTWKINWSWEVPKTLEVFLKKCLALLN